MKEGTERGKRDGSRDIIMRLRVSERERKHLHRICVEEHQTVSRLIRIVLKEHGLLPEDSAI